MSIRVESLIGKPSQATIDALSRLRCAVFREWPYLYEGDPVSEAEYLATFSGTQNAVIVCAYDGTEMVGAATASPLAGHTDEFVPLFEARGYEPEEVFYCGESVLLPAYRGRGIGHAFFDHRESHAKKLNSAGASFKHAAFCGVVRSTDDPRKPASYRPLDAFWSKRGYKKVDEMIGNYRWKEIGHTIEMPHDMQFWIKPL